jgi:molybdate/tungstate transport system substrate-binding protein
MHTLVLQAKSRGITVHGRVIGSSEVIGQASARRNRPDVIVSDTASVDAELDRPRGGIRVAWFVTFASAPLVLAYDAHGPWAARLRKGPWYDVVTKPEFRLGRSDPSSDSEGILTDATIGQIALQRHVPRLLAVMSTPTNIYSDSSLQHDLETGKLDAGFLFANEAKVAGISTLSLKPAQAVASFTVTVPVTSTHQGVADAFVADMLSRSEMKTIAREGLTIAKPLVAGGNSGKIPSSIRKELG